MTSLTGKKVFEFTLKSDDRWLTKCNDGCIRFGAASAQLKNNGQNKHKNTSAQNKIAPKKFDQCKRSHNLPFAFITARQLYPYVNTENKTIAVW